MKIIGGANKFCKTHSSIYKLLSQLLLSQSYINNIYSINDTNINNIINLDKFKQINTNLGAGNSINYYYHIVNQHLSKNFSRPIISFDNIDNEFKDKILLIYTYRYINPNIDYSKLFDFKQHLIFIGLQHQYNLFKSRYFQIPFYKSQSFIDIAKKMLGAKLIIGNQSGLMALAQCIKCNRILLTPERCYDYYYNKYIEGPVNVDPQGGWCDIATCTQKLITLIKLFIS